VLCTILAHVNGLSNDVGMFDRVRHEPPIFSKHLSVLIGCYESSFCPNSQQRLFEAS
jgi:hypothetical protein